MVTVCPSYHPRFKRINLGVLQKGRSCKFCIPDSYGYKWIEAVFNIISPGNEGWTLTPPFELAGVVSATSRSTAELIGKEGENTHLVKSASVLVTPIINTTASTNNTITTPSLEPASILSLYLGPPCHNRRKKAKIVIIYNCQV